MDESKHSRKTLDVIAAIKESAEIFKNNFWLFMFLGFLGNALFVVQELMGVSSLKNITEWIMELVFNIVYFWMMAALIIVSDRLLKGERVTAKEACIDVKNVFWRFLAGGVLYLLMFFGGLLVFIIPGLYLATIYSLAGIPIVLERTGIMEGFKISKNLILGNFWIMFLLVMGILIIYHLYFLVGPFKAVFVGIIGNVLVPYETILFVLLYHRLKDMKGAQTNSSSIEAGQVVIENKSSIGTTSWGVLVLGIGMLFGVMNYVKNIWGISHFIFPVIFVVIGIGILCLKNWARRAFIILATVCLISGMFAFLQYLQPPNGLLEAGKRWFAGMGISSFVFMAGLIFFFQPPVKKQFKKR